MGLEARRLRRVAIGAVAALVAGASLVWAQQIWVGGAAPFQWGDSSVEVPLQITQGGQFGPDFDPAEVVSNDEWGTLTVSFTACDQATFDYTTELGDGSFDLRRLTLPVGARCDAN